jgi:hypothetical protein
MIPHDPIVLANQLASLAALDSTIMLVSRALLMTYPAASREPRADEPTEVTTARSLVEDCRRVLSSLDSHRYQIVARMPTSAEVDCDDWPF